MIRSSLFPASLQSWLLNGPFASSLMPLFQNESKCETFHMKMCSTRSFIFMQTKVILIRMVLHVDSLWNRGLFSTFFTCRDNFGDQESFNFTHYNLIWFSLGWDFSIQNISPLLNKADLAEEVVIFHRCKVKESFSSFIKYFRWHVIGVNVSRDWICFSLNAGDIPLRKTLNENKRSAPIWLWKYARIFDLEHYDHYLFLEVYSFAVGKLFSSRSRWECPRTISRKVEVEFLLYVCDNGLVLFRIQVLR